MRISYLIIFLFLSTLAIGQGYNIDIQINTGQNKDIKLTHYYLDNVFITDSISLDEKGTGSFKGDTLLPQGLYKIYMDENNHFDFLLGADQVFSLSKETFTSVELLVTGAAETEEFQKYVVFLRNVQTKGAELSKKLETATDKQKAEIQKELQSLTPSVQTYCFEINERYPNTLLAGFLMANYIPALDITTVSEEIQQNDTLLLYARFNYQKDHYWDYFDYTDVRLLYTPLYKPKLEKWFTQILYQNYDSIKPEVYTFIENVLPNKRIFQFAVSWFLNASIKSNILGMDALFVDIAKDYYLSGQAFWANEETMKSVRENVAFKEHNLIGLTAPDLTLESLEGEAINLHKIVSRVTVLLIYEPGCSHCKEFVPKLYTDIFQKYKDEGLEVFAIYSMDNKEEWNEFLVKHNMFDWINVWDQNHISQFKILYDARKTPASFVLDENKKIIAKGLTVEQMDRLLTEILKSGS